jgi:hypothetical protein
MERINTFIRSEERGWHTMERAPVAPSDGSTICEEAPKDLGLPGDCFISRIDRLPDGRITCDAAWGPITETAHGTWVTRSDEEIRILLDLAERINGQRGQIARRNAAAIEFMSREE